MSPEEARAAIGKGIEGIVVSNYGGQPRSGMAAPIEMLPAIAEAVAGKAPILIDGSFRRGADILKALALGARAVMLGRPPLWALAAYGSAGVQTILELLQTELGRDMAMCGRPNLKSLDPGVMKIHARRPSQP
jgi:isopentenyl diphosphate isomerase/L-lactate dehydrogenase-like FMN-dependent dehydrogenase